MSVHSKRKEEAKKMAAGIDVTAIRKARDKLQEQSVPRRGRRRYNPKTDDVEEIEDAG